MTEPTRKLIAMVRPWVGLQVVAAMMALLGAAAEQAVPLQVKGVVDRAVSREGLGSAADAVAVLACLVALGQILKLAQRLYTEWAATRLRVRLFEAGVHHILSRPMRWFEREQSGALQVRLERATGAVCDLLKLLLADVLPPFAGMAIAIVLLLTTNHAAGLAAIICTPVMAILTLAQARSQSGIRVAINDSREGQGAGVSEAVLGIQQVKLFRAEEEEARRAGEEASRLGEREMRHHVAMARWDLGKFLAERGGVMATLLLVLHTASSSGEPASLGEIVAIVMLWDRVAEPVRHLHRILDEVGERAVLARTYMELLVTEPTRRPDSAESAGRPCEVIFDHVGLAYDDSTVALRDFSLTIAREGKVALVGPSGSGKTTVAKLLTGLLTPSSGRVMVGGACVRPIENQGKSAMVGLLTQDVHVFRGTIRANVAYGNTRASDEDVREAARLAGLADCIERLPLGYETVVGQHGAGLSGGGAAAEAVARQTGPAGPRCGCVR